MSSIDLIYHYTNIIGLIGIIRNHELWASDCRYLNDGTELTYALDLYMDELRKIDLQQLEYGSGGYRFAGPSLQFFKMFLTCFCENGDLLSQWRGYGIDQGYSIGFKVDKLQALNIGEICPVQYGIENPSEYFSEEMASGQEPTAHPGVEEWHASLWLMPRLARVKHPSFSEEREWRILIQKPSYDHLEQPQEIIFRPSSMGPVPYLSFTFTPDCIAEIIIGPGNHIDTRVESVRDMLKYLDYGEVNVRVSNIPFRM